MQHYLRHTGGPAPLKPAQSYSYTFEELATPNEWHFANITTRFLLRIPHRQRGSWDDFGIVEFSEQEEFLLALLKSGGVEVRMGYPGEFLFPEEAGQARAADLLKSALGLA